MIRLAFFRLLLLLGIAAAAGVAPVAAQNPHGESAALTDCAACHTPAGWRPLRRDLSFDHARVARFPLTGRHAQVGCTACHASLRFDEARAQAGQCSACHTDVHRGRFAARQCSSCHDTRTFRVIDGPEAHARSTFPLTGAHLAVPCIRCHQTQQAGAFTRADVRCNACHRTEAARVTFPDHTAFGAALVCERCHGTTRWQGARFEHTRFPLEDDHARARCRDCHTVPANTRVFTCTTCHHTREEMDDEHRRVSGYVYESLRCYACHPRGRQ